MPYYSWNVDGKCIWGGETLESVLTDDPDGPAYYIAERQSPSGTDLAYPKYKLYTYMFDHLSELDT